MFSLRDSVRRSFSKAPRRAQRNTSRLKVEALETRQLLSTFTLSNAGVLSQSSVVVDQNVSSFQTDGAGDLIELKTNGNLWELSGGVWTQLDQKVASFGVNSSGALEELKTTGNLWVNATPLDTSSWSKISSNVSQAGIDDLGNIYYLTTAGNFNVTNGSNGSTQINPAGDPVMNFEMGGTGNEQVYYQYGKEVPNAGYPYFRSIFDWTDHDAANPYGINVTQAIFDGTQPLEFFSIGQQYAVGTNGDLYVAGSADTGDTDVKNFASGATTLTATDTGVFLYVGEAVTGADIAAGTVITAVGTAGSFTISKATTGTPGAVETVDIFDAADNDRVLFYTPGPTPAVGSLFQAVDTGTGEAITIDNLVGTPDHQYLYFTGETDTNLYFDSYNTSAATPLVQLDKILSTGTGTPKTYQVLGDLQVGGDDSGYVLDFTATKTGSQYVVTNVSLLGASPGAATASVIDANVELPSAAETNRLIEEHPTTTTYSPYTVAPNGNVVVLETGGKLVQYDDATGATGLVLDTIGATQIAYSSNGELFEGKSNGNFWEMTVNFTWTQLDSAGLSSFGITPSGTVYELKTNGNFWNYVGGSGTASDSSGWTQVAANVSTFFIADSQDVNASVAGPNGTFATNNLTDDGQVAYISAGAAYLLLPSQYNLNGDFLAVSSGAISVGISVSPFSYFHANSLIVGELNNDDITLYV